MPGGDYARLNNVWQSLTGAPSIPLGVTVQPPSPDWRSSLSLRAPTGQVVFGCSPTVGTRQQIEAVWGRRCRLQRVYGGTTADLPTLLQICQDLLNVGVIPCVDFNSSATYAARNFSMTNVGGTGATLWQAQANGYFDAGKSAATSFTGLAYPGMDDVLVGLGALNPGLCPSNRIFLSKDHEMENANEGGGNGKVVGTAARVASGTQTEFRAAWRHMRAREKTLGVTNLEWVFNFASGTTTWGTTMTDTGSSGFYPGHDAVDVVAWDPYNSAGVRDNTWRAFSNMLNKFGQLDWWKANFAVDGADTLALSTNGRVYKPAMLAEFGTTDSMTDAAGTLFTAATWATDMAAYLGIAANSAIFRWLIYYNNSTNTILTNPSYRYTGFGGVGRGSVWAGTDPLV